MSPIRVGHPIRWEAEYTFEDAFNTVTGFAYENELFTFGYEDEPDLVELGGLIGVGKRQVVATWTGKSAPTADEHVLRDIVSTCKVGLTMNGTPIIRTAFLGCAWLEEDGSQDLSNSGLRKIMTDGLAEWMLRGRIRDVRACLWCDSLFRADRANAVFHRQACRTAYHRAITTAAESEKNPEALLGVFRCIECSKKKLISEASGLIVEVSSDFVFIGGARDGEDRNKSVICRTCAIENHVDWADYVVPMNVAA